MTQKDPCRCGRNARIKINGEPMCWRHAVDVFRSKRCRITPVRGRINAERIAKAIIGSSP